jgi:hypothetical protein
LPLQIHHEYEEKKQKAGGAHLLYIQTKNGASSSDSPSPQLQQHPQEEEEEEEEIKTRIAAAAEAAHDPRPQRCLARAFFWIFCFSFVAIYI